MKKAVFLTAIGMVMMSSCKKEFTCTCVSEVTEPQEILFNTTQNRAEDACNNVISLTDSTYTCTLK